MANNNLKVEDATIIRPLADFPRDIWGQHFVTFTPQDLLKMEEYSAKIEALKGEVRMMLVDDSIDVVKKMSLIDAVERLGVSYHYENEIEEQLHSIFPKLININFDTEYDLHDTSLHFRIFRQHGYKMPCDVFNKFNEEDCENDMRGAMSLYEASHLRIRGETILDEAFAMTSNVLMKHNGTVSDQACRALKQALHFGIQRIETRHYISSYDEEESRNDTLLQLAKLDSNRLQLLYRQELSQILRWWHDLDFTNKLPYARQRCVECHFWTISMYHEPKYSLARMLLVKTLLVISILDDTYDAYGTFEELQLLTHAFERWDLSLMDEFPTEYMKLVYQFVYNTCEEFAKDMTAIGKPYAAQFTKDRVMDLIRSYLIEAKWCNEKYVPCFEEYMVTSRITGVAQLIITSSLMGMPEVTDVKPFQHIAEAPTAIRACEVISRIMDDIVSHQEEQERGHVASGVECYMKDHNMSRDEAVEDFNKMVEDAWKELNEEFFMDNKHDKEEVDVDVDDDELPEWVLKRARNLARVLAALYKVIDGYTHSAKLIKHDILATYIYPLLIL